MKFIALGDIASRPGREAIQKYIPILREKYAPDFIIANADNASNGLGVSTVHVKELYDYGVDLLTGGDHIWHQKDLMPHLDRAPWTLRPLNYPQGTPGKGFHILEKNNQRLLVIHAQGRLFIDKLTDDPFAAIDKVLSGYTLGQNIDAILIDFHAETTSEKNTLAQYLNGKVSAIVGTHTHIPTADARILSEGTAFITDLGMCGDYDSVLGMEKEVPISNFRTGLKLGHLQPAKGEATLCGLFVETDAAGKAIHIEQIKMGGILNPA